MGAGSNLVDVPGGNACTFDWVACLAAWEVREVHSRAVEALAGELDTLEDAALGSYSAFRTTPVLELDYFQFLRVEVAVAWVQTY